jgi:hypothetical protein
LYVVFRHKGEEVTGENCIKRGFMICIPQQFLFRWSRAIRWVGNMECMRRKRNVYRFVMGKPEGKGPLLRTKGR